MEVLREGKRQEISLMVGASRFVYRGTPLVLLTLDDVRRLPAQQLLISICAACKKIQGRRGAWVPLESYFRDRLNADFSHGYCPDCCRAERTKLDRLKSLTDNSAG